MSEGMWRVTRLHQLINMAADADLTDTCSLWPFGKCGSGYPMVFRDGVPVRGHAVIAESFHGPKPPQKQEAAHSCGNKACINPRHIRWASWQENSADKFKHGKQPLGLSNHAAKLTDDEVRAVRSSTGSAKVVAKKYGIHWRYVYKLRRGDARKHLA